MITNSKIAWGDQLGAQMSAFAELYYIARENNQDICFFKEFKNCRRRYLILENFNITNNVKLLRRLYLPIPEIYCLQFRPGRKAKSIENYKRIYKSNLPGKIDSYYYRFCKFFYKDFIDISGKNGINCDPKLFGLNIKNNYDIQSGFGTYQDWKKYENDIINLFKFKSEIINQGNAIYNKLNIEKLSVSIHFRRGDYLILASLNLGLAYYKKALNFFDKDKYELVIFSDDIEYCKSVEIFKDYKVHYMDSHSASIDMYIMSLCNSNIIANSSFSFWGAMLNKNKDKKVVCPHDFIGESDKDNNFINGNYYPDTWSAL